MVEKKKKMKPEWLDLLLKQQFFGVCKDHTELRKNEINIYCIECNHTMCPHCLSSSSDHKFHRRLQIRRYVYQDVVRIHDIQKFMDCSKIQQYIVNSAKVVLLNSQKKLRVPAKVGSVFCKLCNRAIYEPNEFCSIACKVSEESVETNVSRSDESAPSISTLTPDIEGLPPKEVERHPSFSSQQSEEANEEATNDLEVVPKKRAHDLEEEVVPKKRTHRRKGVPRRAPFF